MTAGFAAKIAAGDALLASNDLGEPAGDVVGDEGRLAAIPRNVSSTYCRHEGENWRTSIFALPS